MSALSLCESVSRRPHALYARAGRADPSIVRDLAAVSRTSLDRSLHLHVSSPSASPSRVSPASLYAHAGRADPSSARDGAVVSRASLDRSLHLHVSSPSPSPSRVVPTPSTLVRGGRIRQSFVTEPLFRGPALIEVFTFMSALLLRVRVGRCRTFRSRRPCRGGPSGSTRECVNIDAVCTGRAHSTHRRLTNRVMLEAPGSRVEGRRWIAGTSEAPDGLLTSRSGHRDLSRRLGPATH